MNTEPNSSECGNSRPMFGIRVVEIKPANSWSENIPLVYSGSSVSGYTNIPRRNTPYIVDSAFENENGIDKDDHACVTETPSD
jgi:hypothetical protein